MKGGRLATSPKIDGVLSPGEWAAAQSASSFVDPITGSPPNDNTEVWIGFDDKAIYAAFFAKESRPEEIIATEIQPGSTMENDDRVWIQIDFTNQRTFSNAAEFIVNARGTMTENFSGGRVAKREWRGQWQAMATRTEGGYVVEMRIPWDMLNYPKPGQPITADLNFNRYQARTKILSRWANTGPQRKAELAGMWHEVVTPRESERSKVQHMPYLIGEYDDERKKSEIRAGLDVRWQPSEQFTVLSSFNPDFKNVEGQIAGIEFSRSERFLDDNRPFFREGSGYFNLTNQFTFARMFYSRRIGAFDWGVKAFGNLAKGLSMGALVTRQGDDETNAVINVKRDFHRQAGFNVYSTIKDKDQRSERAYGGGAWYGSGSWIGAARLVIDEAPGKYAQAGAIVADYSVPNFFSTLQGMWVEPDFDPPHAFFDFNDKRGFYSYTEYDREHRSGPIRRTYANLFFENYEHYDHSNLQKSAELGLELFDRADHYYSLYLTRRKYEDVHDRLVTIDYGMNRSKKVWNLSGTLQLGERSSEDQKFFAVGLQHRVGKALDFAIRQSVLEFGDTTRQTVGTLSWQLDARQSLTGRWVKYNGENNAYFAYRRAGFSGMEIFVIVGDPNAEKFQRRLTLKLVWAI